jgi:medium-chain acyl-[acyl-carrier-protein] hydrolase
MPSLPRFREEFVVHTYEVDAFGTLAVPALAGFLVEAAGLHARSLGAGIEALHAKGLTWVLARQRLEIPQPIRLGDVVEVETWPAGIDRVSPLRDFVVRRGPDEVARGTTQWFVLDVQSRRPVRPDTVLDARFPRERSEPVVQLAAARPTPLAGWEREKRFHVRFADIDVNAHANHGSYLAWALEGVPRELWQSSRVSAIEVQYLAECLYGSAVLSRLAPAGDGRYEHAIVREEDGKELARVTTAWVPR